ncbi:hypothetical protein IF1G_10194 [Cordyceps javanica]|uniref:Uncharacterized protein n=1 Tax=Cordyceps javanica TaxID=43265 RepID=A0A545UPF8_9HYPO|nr:hypothetical protein IF1G_10194 [Cordyceps javanica]
MKCPKYSKLTFATENSRVLGTHHSLLPQALLNFFLGSQAGPVKMSKQHAQIGTNGAIE